MEEDVSVYCKYDKSMFSKAYTFPSVIMTAGVSPLGHRSIVTRKWVIMYFPGLLLGMVLPLPTLGGLGPGADSSTRGSSLSVW